MCAARDAVFSLVLSCPHMSLALGAIMRAGYCRFQSTPIRFGFPRAVPRAALFLQVSRESEAAMAVRSKDVRPGADGKDAGPAGHGGDGAEVAEERVQVVERAAAIDVAKGSGMVCTRVPGSRPDRRRQKVWQVTAAYGEVTALMDQLRGEGIQRLVLESTSDYWRTWVRHEVALSE